MALSVLFLGFLIGMKHAVEADHVAAVASLATRSAGPGEAARLGIAWGMGHTITLFLIGSVVLMIGVSVPETTARILELAVGVMLVILGADVVRRMIRQGVHIHAHRHDDGGRHVHLHTHHEHAKKPHTAPADHAAAPHGHSHRKPFPLRAVFVGLIHGMAGSAALVLLTLGTIDSVALGIAYIALFGVGSIAGMAILSLAISLPLRLTAERFRAAYTGLTLVIGVLTVLLGGSIVWQIGFADGLLL